MAKKAKVKVKNRPKNQSNRQQIGKTKVRTTMHIRFDADGNQRRKGW